MKERLRIMECTLADIRDFVERYHYSQSVTGVTSDYCFKVEMDGVLAGAAIFGRPGMKQTMDRYSKNGKVHLTELRRFVMIDEAPRNSESFCLAVMFRILKKKGIQRILSYADPQYGHLGTIYKATGFTCVGKTKPILTIYLEKQRYHERNIDPVQEQLSPFAKNIRTALMDGSAEMRKQARKFIYCKDLVRLA